MTIFTRLRDVTEATRFIDTHEHLPDESLRLANGMPRLGCGDWSVLFSHYCCYDLCTSGMADELQRRFYVEPGDPAAKYDLIAPYWAHMKHSGFGQAVRKTLQGLYGEDDLTRDSAPRIAEKYNEMLRPGLYEEVLVKRARIDSAQVNTKQSTVFHRTAHPELLLQDIEITSLCNPATFAAVTAEFGVEPVSLDAWVDLIDSLFERFAPHAVAVKSVMAYARRLDVAATDRRAADRVFRRWRTMGLMDESGRRAIEDFLFRHCLSLAAQHDLPVKLHTGINSFANSFSLESARNNPVDLFPLFVDFPDVRFDLFHIGYPYWPEMVALSKHHTNVAIDMCWAWILDPVSSVRFLKSFLTAAPANKVFGFGGDYFPVEPVYGHAQIARHGIARALTELVEEGWMHVEEAEVLITRIMRQNAIEFFRLDVRPAPVSSAASCHPLEKRGQAVTSRPARR